MKLGQIAVAMFLLFAGGVNAAPVYPDVVIKLEGTPASRYLALDAAESLCMYGIGHTTTKLFGNEAREIDAVYCSAGVSLSSGLPSSTKVLVMINNRNGSYYGTLYSALMRKSRSTMLKLTGLDDTCGTTCDTTWDYADGGFYDLDEQVWIGRGQFDPSQVSGGYTVRRGFAGQGYGIAVTKALYVAMQRAQGLNDSDDSPGANQPNITSQQFTSIISASGGYKIDWLPIVGPAGEGMAINLCRRTGSSGTQAAVEAFFLGNPCQKTASPTFGALNVATESDTSPGKFVVVENPSAADVKTCLGSRNGVADMNQFAIGVMSLVNGEGSGYRYVKLDGVSPNEEPARRQSVVDGRYNFAEEMELAYRNDAPATVRTYLRNFGKVLTDPSKYSVFGVFAVPGASASGQSTHSAYPNRVHKGTRSGNACHPFELYE